MSKASAKAYQAIRGRILGGEFAPGSRLKEEELAEVCGVSRTPIRDALRMLAAEYYVTIVPNHGTFVSQWTVGDIEDIFNLRAMLEGYGARRAAERADAAQIAALADHAGAIQEMLDRSGPLDAELFLDHNRRFHQILTEAAGSERLSLMISRLVEQPVLMRTALSYSRADLQRSNNHHLEIVSAVRAGQGAWAESVMTSHIMAAFQVFKAAHPQLVADSRTVALEEE